jgi:hypothetical protein
MDGSTTGTSPALQRIREEIIADPANRDATAAGLQPIYTAHPAARIVLIGQAAEEAVPACAPACTRSSSRTSIRWAGKPESEMTPSTMAETRNAVQARTEYKGGAG